MGEFNIVQITFPSSRGRGINNLLSNINLESPVQMIKVKDLYIYKIRISEDNVEEDDKLQYFMKMYYLTSFRKSMRNIQIFNHTEITGDWNKQDVLRRQDG